MHKMNKLHSYSLADLKYNIKRSKSKQYSRFLKKNIKTQKGSGEHVGNNNKHMFDIEDVYDEDEEIRKIFIGKSDANMCMVGMIFDSTPEEIVIETFNYKKTCNLTADLERVTGVKKMMKTYLKYVKQKYPGLTKAILSDEASFNCIDAITNKIEKIPLYKLYLIKYKSSYYERNHDFIIEKERNSIVHHNNVSKLDTLTFDYDTCITELKTQKITIPDTVCTGLQAQCNGTAITSILHPPGVGLEFNVDGNIDDIIHNQDKYSYEDIKKIVSALAEHKYCEILDIVLEYIFKTNKLTNLSGVLYYKDLI